MKTARLSALVGLTVLLAACGTSGTRQAPKPDAQPPQAPPQEASPDATGSYVKGQVVVGLSGATAAEAAAAVGGRVLREIPRLKAAVIGLPAGTSVKEAASTLAALSGVRYAEPNRLLKLPKTEVGNANPAAVRPQATSDPQFGFQWFHRQMKTEAAYAQGATGKGIRIAVVDQDIDRAHPDLAPNIVYPGYYAPKNALITPTTPYDEFGQHGTWVAGTAAATGNNNKGGAGVAYDASIVPITVEAPGTGGASEVDSALSFLFALLGPDSLLPGEPGDGDTPPGRKGYADIINYSYGGDFYGQLSAEAINFVVESGVIFVTSAGNTPTLGPSFPSWHPGVIDVAATQANGQRTNFSNKGYHLSVAAPGENIWTTASRRKAVGDDQSAANVKYEYVNGTSFSSPATAGAVALMLEASATKDGSGNITALNLGHRQVKRILELTAAGTGNTLRTDLGYGIVDAAAAVARAKSGPFPAVGATVGFQFVQQSDPSIKVPLVGITLIGPDGVPLYAQSADGGGIFIEGFALYSQINPGLYNVYASGPRQALTGVIPGNVVGQVPLAPGFNGIITVPLNVAAPVDTQEPNNSAAAAAAASLGDTRFGTLPLGDEDWYAVSVTAGQKLWINTENLGGSTNTKVELYAANGTTKLAENSGNRKATAASPGFLPDAALEYTATASGTLYARVTHEGAGANPFNSYLVSFTAVAGAESEPNGSATINSDVFGTVSFTGANPVAVGASVDGVVSPSTDVDFYSFTGAAGQKVVVDLETPVNSQPDTVLALFASDGTLVTSNDDADLQDSRLTATLTAAGTYYVGVASFNQPPDQPAKTGAYRMSLTNNLGP